MMEDFTFRSEGGGDSWRELEGMRRLPSSSQWSFPPKLETSHVRWISPDPAVPGRLFVGIEAGALIRSHDGGETWESRVSEGPIDTHTLAVREDVSGRLYSAAGDGFFSAEGGYLESPDGGDSWERLKVPWPERYLQQHPQALLVSSRLFELGWIARTPSSRAVRVTGEGRTGLREHFGLDLKEGLEPAILTPT